MSAWTRNEVLKEVFKIQTEYKGLIDQKNVVDNDIALLIQSGHHEEPLPGATHWRETQEYLGKFKESLKLEQEITKLRDDFSTLSAVLSYMDSKYPATAVEAKPEK